MVLLLEAAGTLNLQMCRWSGSVRIGLAWTMKQESEEATCFTMYHLYYSA